jgi:hypothetical protein
MFKVTSLVFGQMRIDNKVLGYNEHMLVKEITDKITELQTSRLVKVIQLSSKPVTKEEKSKKKKNSGGN